MGSNVENVPTTWNHNGISGINVLCKSAAVIWVWTFKVKSHECHVIWNYWQLYCWFNSLLKLTKLLRLKKTLKFNITGPLWGESTSEYRIHVHVITLSYWQQATERSRKKHLALWLMWHGVWRMSTPDDLARRASSICVATKLDGSFNKPEVHEGDWTMRMVTEVTSWGCKYN